jgi:hypothetical protein
MSLRDMGIRLVVPPAGVSTKYKVLRKAIVWSYNYV